MPHKPEEGRYSAVGRSRIPAHNFAEYSLSILQKPCMRFLRTRNTLAMDSVTTPEFIDDTEARSMYCHVNEQFAVPVRPVRRVKTGGSLISSSSKKC